MCALQEGNTEYFPENKATGIMPSGRTGKWLEQGMTETHNLDSFKLESEASLQTLGTSKNKIRSREPET